MESATRQSISGKNSMGPNNRQLQKHDTQYGNGAVEDDKVYRLLKFPELEGKDIGSGKGGNNEGDQGDEDQRLTRIADDIKDKGDQAGCRQKTMETGQGVRQLLLGIQHQDQDPAHGSRNHKADQ